jgi:hypothetical protein
MDPLVGQVKVTIGQQTYKEYNLDQEFGRGGRTLALQVALQSKLVNQLEVLSCFNGVRPDTLQVVDPGDKGYGLTVDISPPISSSSANVLREVLSTLVP